MSIHVLISRTHALSLVITDCYTIIQIKRSKSRQAVTTAAEQEHGGVRRSIATVTGTNESRA